MNFSHQFRRSVSFLLGIGTAVTVGATAPVPATALPVGDLLFRGIQLLQLSNLSTQQKVQLGQDIHQQVLRNYRLSSNSQLNNYVNRVGQRVAGVSDCAQTPFRFYVVDNPQINAFATTGGFVYVHTGLIQATDNEDQLASVIAHEIAHICNDDLIAQLRQTAIAQGAASLAGLDRSAVAGLAYQLAVGLPYSRQAEFNADARGLDYLTRAGYDPRAMPAFLSKLLKYPSPPAFLSSHPATRDRITALEQRIARSN